jgi:hypothetical protein
MDWRRLSSAEQNEQLLHSVAHYVFALQRQVAKLEAQSAGNSVDTISKAEEINSPENEEKAA